MSPRLEGVAWATAIVLAAGSLYELLVATEVVPIGDVPGEGAPGADVVRVAGLLALVVAAGAAFVRSLDKHGPAVVWALLAPVGAAYVVASWYGFDPYYLPTLRRYAEGEVPGPWVVAAVLAAIGAGALVLVRPRLGAVASSVVLLVEALTVFGMPLGK